MSILLLLNGSLAASGLVVREKELGTIEQLLMTPAGTLEIFLAKSVPLLVVLLADLAVALAVTRLAFGLPMRGSLGLLLLTATLASIAGIGMGILISAYCNRLQQAQILAFFINPPLVLISGAVSPVESMSRLFQQATHANPLFYLVSAMRAILLKGAGLDVLWPQLLTLAGFAVVLYGLAAWRFRRQLG
jgi:ABC-2 type transport system permease protein